MNPKGVHGSQIAAVLLAVTFIFAGLFSMVRPEVTEAKLSEETDSGGYVWMDNQGPEPMISFAWEDAKMNGGEFTELTTTSEVTSLSLPFPFPYYGEVFYEIWVTSYGYLTLQEIDYGDTSYSSNIPNSNGQGGQIAVDWCSAYDYYTPGGVYGGVWYYIDPGNDFVCVEWNRNSVGATAEVILYSSGLIKLQWKELGTQDYYKDGNYLVAGIESPDEDTGLCYSRYSQANLLPNMAVAFSTNLTAIESLSLVNGDSDGHICYAENGPYEFNAVISSPAGGFDIQSARILFSNYSIPLAGRIGVDYRIVSGLPVVAMLPGSDQFISIDIMEINPNPLNMSLTMVKIKVQFYFEFPMTGNMSLSVWAAGKYSLPDFKEFEDAFYLDNKVQLVGDLTIYGKGGRTIKPTEYTAGNETINITGLTLCYEKHFEGIYAPNGSFYVGMRDELNNMLFQFNMSGRVIFFKWNMPLEAIKKTFLLIIFGIPAENLLNPVGDFWLQVDNSPPSAPTDMKIRADSRIDPQTLVDNDDTLYVSWSTVNDIGSGVGKYRINTEYLPDDDDVPWVDAKTTSYIWQGTTPGEFTLFVWAEDFVGYDGDPIKRVISIDKDAPSFYDFTLLENYWIKTLTPDTRITVKDNLTEGVTGVWGESIEYSISTNGTENFREWITANILENDLQIEVRIRPQFEEGIDNWIKFRAKDVAGNGFVESRMYKLWIDVTEVQFSDVFPTQNVWHDLSVVNSREVETTLFDATSGVNTGEIWYRIATAKDDEGNPIWSTGIDQEGNWLRYSVRPGDRLNGDDSLIHVHFVYDEFVEGDNNILQFRTNDRAGNGKADSWTLSPYYFIDVNTGPIAVITNPVDGDRFQIDELFTLDASGSYDIDVDKNNLKFEWYEGSNLIGTGKTMYMSVRLNILGTHIITLYVSDPVHQYNENTGIDSRANASVQIEIYRVEFSKDVDSDGDGMDDWWEDHYGLDPFDPDDALIDSDGDGFSNIEEYKGTPKHPESTDPMDPLSFPIPDIRYETPEVDPPFTLILFVLVILITVIVAAIIVSVSYIRMNRKEDREKREETEEEAMLVTPQLDIPTMPVMPMVDTSIPTLPAAGPTEGQEALPPAPGEAQPQPGHEAPAPTDNPFGNAPVQ